MLAQAYVVTRDAAGGDGGVWIQERLVRDGHAQAYALPGNSGCLHALMAAEQEARAAQRGVWSRETYRVREADDTDALLRMVGRFPIVEGARRRVSRGPADHLPQLRRRLAQRFHREPCRAPFCAQQ